jgi:hypothetical protein
MPVTLLKKLDRILPIGTRSVLFGTHCWFVHPIFVWLAWTKLFGFPWDPRLWVAFFVHDLGYWQMPNMDGPEGQTHVEWGAKVMHKLFDLGTSTMTISFDRDDTLWSDTEAWLVSEGYELITDTPKFREYRKFERDTKWYDLCLYHSRYYAKKYNHKPSQLCIADKLSIALEPWWLYLPRTKASGELAEYMGRAKARADSNEKLNDEERAQLTGQDARTWFEGLKKYMIRWVEEHRDSKEDTWTASAQNSNTQ